MIVFAVELDELRLEVPADAAENIRQIAKYVFREHSTTIFGHKDQMHMQVKDAVSSPANFI